MSAKDSVNAVQVQSTNDASIVSKCSMAKRNYIKDDFVEYFVEKEKRRASLIHLGYYARAVIFSKLLIQFIQFLKLHNILKFQIISCGAGFDTSYWRLTECGLLDENSVFVEIDYPNVINRKISLIKESDKLKSVLNFSDIKEGDSLKKLNCNYFLLCADLCDLERVEELFRKINIDFSIPTLFLSECVITYMKVGDSNRLIRWVSDKFTNGGFVIYEQIHPEDGFGDVMLKHFNKLQSSLHSVMTYPDCMTHRERYQLLGFEKSLVLSEWEYLELLTSSEERQEALRLEQFDEFEEFHLKCVHYVVAVATKNILSEWSAIIADSQLLNRSLAQGPTKSSEGHFVVADTEVELELFSQASCCLSDGTVLLIGGFGPNGRSSKVHTVRDGNMYETLITDANDYRFDAIHGSSVSFEINGATYVGLYGGRTSPDRVCNNGSFLLLEHHGNKLILKCAIPCTEGPTPRYRNSMVCQSRGSTGVSVWVFGGRTHDLKVSLPEMWELIIRPDFTCKWVVKEPKGLAPSGRMSHSAVVSVENDAMYVTGGLDTENFTVLNDLWKWLFRSESWERIEPRNRPLIPRYGHTSHIHKNFLYLIGGVNTSAGFQPGLAILNLDTLHLTELSVEPFRVVPVLLFNHASAVVQGDDEEDKILIFGGGGNCFSFGTYLNKNVHAIRLNGLCEIKK